MERYNRIARKFKQFDEEKFLAKEYEQTNFNEESFLAKEDDNNKIRFNEEKFLTEEEYAPAFNEERFLSKRDKIEEDEEQNFDEEGFLTKKQEKDEERGVFFDEKKFLFDFHYKQRKNRLMKIHQAHNDYQADENNQSEENTQQSFVEKNSPTEEDKQQSKIKRIKVVLKESVGEDDESSEDEEYKRPEIKVRFTPETYRSYLKVSDAEFFQSVLNKYSDILRTDGKYREEPFLKVKGKFVENAAWQNRANQIMTSGVCFGNLCKLAQDVICERFGEDALTDYGVSDDLYIGSIPSARNVLAKENYLFMHNNVLLDAMIKAPKLPIEPWQENKGAFENTKFYSQRCIMNVDGQIILCQNSVFPKEVCDKSQGEIRFDVFFRGNKKCDIRIEKWDFEPNYQEVNRYIDSETVYFIQEGIVPENTRYSHVHKRTVRQRIVNGSGFFGDITQTPINKDPTKLERRYKTFNDMLNSYLDEHNVSNQIFDQGMINKLPLKQLGLLYCPQYSSVLRKVVSSSGHPEENSCYFVPYSGDLDQKRFDIYEDSYVVEEDWSPMQMASQQTLRFTGLKDKESRFYGRQLWEQRLRNHDLSTEAPGMGRLK